MYTEMMTIPIVMGLVQVIKRTNLVNRKYLPLISVLLGVCRGLALSFTGEGFMIGLMFGLASCGLFDVAMIPLKPRKD